MLNAMRRWIGRVVRALEKTFAENPAQWLVEMFGGRSSGTGVVVTPSSAMQCGAVYSCVRILAETVGSLPLITYRRLEDEGKERDPDHHLYPILHDAANPEQTAMEFRELLQGHLALRGNGYAEIVRNGRGQVAALWPLNPDQVRVERAADLGLVYVVTLPRGQRTQDGGDEVRLPAARVLHLRGLSSDGVQGLSPIALARETIGLTLAVEEYGARFFGQGASPSGVLKHPAKLHPETHAKLRDEWEEMHSGLSQAHRVAILEEGMEWQQLGLQNDHAQFLQTRKFQLSEIARLFRIPPHMIGDLEKATFSNIEQQSIEFIVHTIRPWAVRWEQALMLKLLTPAERLTHFVEHVIDGLLRGDVKSRYDAYAVGRQWGWLSADDVRGLENMNPLPNGQGQIYMVPLNMQPADMPMPPGPAPAKRAEEARLRLLLQDAATRSVRRETRAIRDAAVTFAGDVDGWRRWVDQFYGRYAAYISEVFHVSAEAARGYAEDHRAALIAHGIGILDEWEREGPPALLALAA